MRRAAQARDTATERVSIGTVAALLFAFAYTASTLGASNDQVGFVLEMSGRWQLTLNGEARPVSRGQSIPQGVKLTAVTPGARITVVMLDGSRIVCPADARCGAPLKRTEPDQSAMSRLVDAVAGLFAKPERYASTMSRGEELHEAVLELGKDEALLTELFRGMPAGRFTLSFESLASDAMGEPTMIAVAWNPESPTPTGLSGVEPGLYRAYLESEADAWVLLLPSSRYAAGSAKFAEARALTDTWGDDVPRATVRSFLRAALEAISASELAMER